ncbi:hypothetical protein MTX26_08585 [Bradyrhizobium sp. ISRA443]|uniref:DUF4286 family protein n=1 Tax=unclassified Bradyrhizobium TaxID=2631580 RepID=UPI002478F7FF|nr:MULTISPECIES: DUF4286 family protein [unclassified Bradyrhizobium]WGR95756.1 hypothetical protein MTX20_18880 [Bradyrhizobium sp. ISRA435]WGS00863.1 hypothetical protein MTX23_08580 [Bradyrhizobium sp. ISRA436]WGS07750.1 hypothetical protein MTX18_08585 [Bradyrhizobium sp. ISRA437]WGS14638.1 hypothetical protein MTX26_08585 [Bradyrhizobium sp. ISRA443]
MPITGQGMLLTSMDVDSLHEAEFNRWYDREHIEERVAIDGFIEARRYVAHDGRPKYLSLYSTATFDVLDSEAYRTALANQTEWSKANIARFKNMIRGVARITISRGTGRGAALGIIRLRPPADGADKLRAALEEQLDPSALDGIISMHLLENDPVLSRPLTPDVAKADPGAGDWFVLIDATDVDAVPAAAARIIDNAALKPLVVTNGVYRLLWDLAKSDLPRD